MNYFDDLINKAIKKKKVISICVNKIDWDNRHIGYITQYEPFKLLIIIELNYYGGVKGSKYIRFEDLRSVEFGGSYNESLEKGYKSNIWKVKKTTRYLKNIGIPYFAKRLEMLKSKKLVCRIFFNDNYSFGIIQNVSEKQVLIKNVSYLGKEDGFSSCNIKSITRIRYNGPDELKITELYGR